MARYFFHLVDGRETLIDPDGRDVEDVAALGDLAIRDARAIISHDALAGHVRLDQAIEIRDEKGRLVLRLPFRDAVNISE